MIIMGATVLAVIALLATAVLMMLQVRPPDAPVQQGLAHQAPLRPVAQPVVPDLAAEFARRTPWLVVPHEDDPMHDDPMHDAASATRPAATDRAATEQPAPPAAPPADPATEAEFYDGVPLKRLLAWVVDVVLIALLTVVAVPLTAFIGLFFLPLLFAVIGFLYRWVGLTRHSATPGMRIAAIEIRDRDGQRLDPLTSLLHTLGYVASVSIFPAQLVSIALMLVTPRRQGLTDLVLGTAAVRRSAMF